MFTASLFHSHPGAPVRDIWSDTYPPDFDHGGQPLLGENPERWADMLDSFAFLGAECTLDGRVVVVVATVREGFVEVTGQVVRQGEPLADDIAEALLSRRTRVPVDRQASALLGLAVELDQTPAQHDPIAAARRIEVDLLSTIQSHADGHTPS